MGGGDSPLLCEKKKKASSASLHPVCRLFLICLVCENDRNGGCSPYRFLSVVSQTNVSATYIGRKLPPGSASKKPSISSIVKALSSLPISVGTPVFFVRADASSSTEITSVITESTVCS